jgi:putative oxidoreductase
MPPSGKGPKQCFGRKPPAFREELKMREFFGIERGWGITVVRVVMGIILIVAGLQKFMTGLGVVAAGFEKIPVPLPGLTAPFISVLELVGGVCLLVGLWTRWFGLIFALEHLVTTFWVKFRLQGWNSGRLELMLVAAGILLLLSGPGKAAIDKE